MAKPVTLLRIFLAAPSDIGDEVGVAFEVIHEWNDVHGSSMSAMLKLVSWKTDCAPAAGDRPQAIINEQALDESDILVGIFWSRFGSPTGVADSGTEEEVRRSVAVGRRVMLYFSQRPIPAERHDAEQHQKVIRFKDEFKARGLYWTHSSTSEFRELFRKHLPLAVHEVLRRLRSEAVTPPPASNTVNFTGSNQGIVANQVVNSQVTVKLTKKRGQKMAHPDGTIGSDVNRGNYVRYLTKRYNEFREKDANFGSFRPFHYSVIHKNIEAEFGSPTNFLPVTMFDAVVEYLHGRIDDTILGRNNRKKGIPNFKSFQGFLDEQASKARPRKPKS